MKTHQTSIVSAALSLVSALVCGGCLPGPEDRIADVIMGEGATDEAALAIAPTPGMLQILDEREGWGEAATGGQSGNVYHVTTAADVGPGSLREALEDNSAKWIVFDQNFTITLQSRINIKSNKTVDARGKSIRITTANSEIGGLAMHGISNVIVINVDFDGGYEGYDHDDEGGDGININNSHDIWIHHCNFTRWSDGGIDIRSTIDRPHNVSVTWCYFGMIFQAMLWEGDKLSLGHSWCEVSARCPKIVGSGNKGHSYNNYIMEWGVDAIQNAKEGGQLYAERNMYFAGGTNSVNKFEGGKIKVEHPYAFNSVTFVSGDDSVSSGFISDSDGNANVRKCDMETNPAACWYDLRSRLIGDIWGAAAGATL